MKFCVIGDSWGLTSPTIPGYQGLDLILQKRGHEVVNVSQSGASNFGQLLVLDFQVLQQGQTDFDYIIWLHTEPVRDFTEFISLHYGVESDDNLGRQQFPELTFRHFYKDLEYLNDRNYAYAQQLYETYHIPFLVIGGAGKLNESIKNFGFVHWSQISWFQQILNLNDSLSIPKNCYHHHVLRMCDGRYYNRAEFLEEIELLDQLEKAMLEDPTKFPDGGHVAEHLYVPMLDQLLKSI